MLLEGPMRARVCLSRLGVLGAIAASFACGRPGPTMPPPQPPAQATTEVTAGAPPAQTPVTGLFRYVADQATFQECTTGKELQVSMEADYLNTERAYTSAAAASPGAPMVIKAFVHVVQRPHATDPERHSMIVIDRLVETSNDTSACPAAKPAAASLWSTRWRLVELDGKPVPEPGAQPWPAPSIVLDEREQSVTGFAGCNDMRGSWRLPEGVTGARDRGRLALSSVATTRRTCAASTLETDFLRALEQTRRFEVSGSTLVLFDDSGPRARFEAQRN